MDGSFVGTVLELAEVMAVGVAYFSQTSGKEATAASQSGPENLPSLEKLQR